MSVESSVVSFPAGKSAQAFAKNRVEACIRRVELLRITLSEANQVTNPGFVSSRRRLPHVLWTEIDADNVAAEALGEEHCGLPLAACDIQYLHTRGQRKLHP